MCATVFMSAPSVQHVLRVSAGALLNIFGVINRAHSHFIGHRGHIGSERGLDAHRGCGTRVMPTSVCVCV